MHETSSRPLELFQISAVFAPEVEHSVEVAGLTCRSNNNNNNNNNNNIYMYIYIYIYIYIHTCLNIYTYTQARMNYGKTITNGNIFSIIHIPKSFTTRI